MNEPRHNEQQFIEQTKAALERQTEALDYITVQRLGAARRRALATPDRRPWLMPVQAFTAASVMALAVGLWWTGPASQNGNGSLPAVADIALLASADGVEFYDDLEFYVWLAEAPDAG